MSLIENIPYKKSFIVKDDLSLLGKSQTISISKYLCGDIYDRYYLRVNTKDDNNNPLDQGYLYFYLDFEERKSEFIGVKISQEYRNCGLASLLISVWIQFCLDEGFLNLQTISKQRKPFVLYLLKKYEFELRNLTTYRTSTRTVHICKKENEDRKCIMFENKQEENRFRNSNIMKTDNYRIIGKEEQNISILDSVVLYTPYFLQDQEKAYQKSLQFYNSKR